MAASLVRSNLLGHDSHGVRRLTTYASREIGAALGGVSPLIAAALVDIATG